MEEQEILQKVLNRVVALENEIGRLRQQMEQIKSKLADKQGLQGSTRTAETPAPPQQQKLQISTPTPTETSQSLFIERFPAPDETPESDRFPAKEEPPVAKAPSFASAAPAIPGHIESAPKPGRSKPAAAPAKPRFDWKTLLQRLHMLPPEGEGSLEIQVGTWWAMRIGIIMAVIGVVFFGIWASQGTPAWVKWSELVGISLGVCALGLMIERLGKELAGFGGIVFSGGLALIYFSAFAGYAVPAVKIFPSPEPSFALQLVAIALIVGCALWRRSETIAAMAVLLGYVACVFSFDEGLLSYALAASILLGCGAVFFYLWRRWTTPFLLAVPLTHLITALIAARWIIEKDHPAFWFCMGYPLLTMVLYGFPDLVALRRGIEIAPIRRRIIQLTNSTGAVLIGFFVTRTLFEGQLDAYYFAFGSLLLAGSVVYCFMKHPDMIMHSYFVKGSALVTMGLITALDARTRWVALAIQSLVLLLSAKRSRLKIVEAASTITWVVSFIYFSTHSNDLPSKEAFVPILSADGMMLLGYFLFTCVLFGLHGRWFIPSRAPGLSPMVSKEPKRHFLTVIHIFLLGLLTLDVAQSLSTSAYQPLALTILAVVLALSSVGFGHWAGYIAGGFIFFQINGHIWDNFSHLGLDEAYWLTSLPAVAVTLATASLMSFYGKKQEPFATRKKILDWADGIHMIWIFTLTVMFYRSFDYEYFLLASTMTGVALAAIAWRFPILKRLADLAVLPLVLAMVGAILGHDTLPHAQAYWPLWAIVPLAGLIPLGTGCLPALNTRIEWMRKNDLYLGIHSVAAGGVMVLALRGIFDGGDLMIALAVAGVLIALLRRWPGLITALAWAIIFMALAAVEFLREFGHTAARGDNLFLAQVILTAICTAALAPLAPRLNRAIAQNHLRASQWGLGALTLLLLFALFISRTGPEANYVSVFWGLSAIALFGVGLADRIKPFRILGLLALALCIGRVFLVDIQLTVYRIAAFVVIGCVLLVVGFLYNKYRDVIEAIDQPATEESDGEGDPAGKNSHPEQNEK